MLDGEIPLQAEPWWTGKHLCLKYNALRDRETCVKLVRNWVLGVIAFAEAWDTDNIEL